MYMNLNKNRIIFMNVLIVIYVLIQFTYIKLLFDIKYILDIILLISIIIAIILSFTNGKKIIKMDKVFLIFLLFSFWVSITTLYSESNFYAIEKLWIYIRTILFFILIRNSIIIYLKTSNNSLIKLFTYIFKLNVLLLYFYMFLNLGIIIDSFLNSSRFETELANPIWLSRFISETMLGVLILVKLKTINFFWILLVSPFLFLMIISGSKGPILSLFISFFLFLIIFTTYKNKNKNYFLNKIKKFVKNSILPLILAILIIVISINFLPQDFIYARFSLDSIFSNMEGLRVDRYLRSIEIIKDNLIFGVGLGGWPIKYSGIDIIDYPHNIILEIFSEIGLIGLTLFLLILVLVSVNITFKNIDYKMIYVLFIFNFINAMFSGDIASGNRGFFLYLSILSALYENKNINSKYIYSDRRRDFVKL
jgi:O-antigen ligase